MKSLNTFFQNSVKSVVPCSYQDVCEGFVPFFLSAFAEKTPGPIVYIAAQEQFLKNIQESLQHINPALCVYIFPRLDILPYDRISPNPRLCQQRLQVLAQLKNNLSNCIILTTIPALQARLLPKNALQEIFLKTSEHYQRDHLLRQFIDQGFYKTDSVQDVGTFAVRGSVIDIFPAGPAPIRLDWFGDQLESIKTFDPVTQRTQVSLDQVSVLPVTDIVLNDVTVTCFRKSYRQAGFLKNPDTPDIFYETISSHRHYAGMEHWLPLFYPTTDTFFDYPHHATIVCDNAWKNAAQTFFQAVETHYQNRTQEHKEPSISYLEPAQLYLNAEEFEQKLRLYAFVSLNAGENAFSLQTFPLPLYQKKRLEPTFTAWLTYLKELYPGLPFIICCQNLYALQQMQITLEHYPEYLTTVIESTDMSLGKDALNLMVLDLPQGFSSPLAVFITAQELLGYSLRSRTQSSKQANFVIKDILEGELVVHKDHGIGRYKCIRTLMILNQQHDCLELEYRSSGTLLIPVENINVLTRYGEETGELDTLGTAAWQNRKAKIKKRITEIAHHLIAVAAERERQQGTIVTPLSGLYETFCDTFAYVETPDQLQAIDDVLQDLSSGKPMDRLICGDVGFGKTEVAMRAAFIAAAQGLQVAVIVPTTILCRQHCENFQQRFEGTNMNIRQLSRLVSAKEAKKVKQEIAEGTAHIIVATHGVLNPKISWHNLGLIIIDEEHHFGVIQKEALKKIKSIVHVLTLTATPIPRTLQLSLAGIRSLSLITTPPEDRLAVRTIVFSYDISFIKEAIEREYNRGGQIFYVCPHIEDLDKIALKIQELFPKLRITKAHGQLVPTVLERIMTEFYDHHYDLLLSTPIIESGIDVPTVNTIIIHRAERFGLAQLYQLRGRVGRGKVKGYAYLCTTAGTILSETAQKRLDVIAKLDYLGAGFALASHDMEIRGTGNIVGQEQSGHIKEIGIELYQQMLQEALLEHQEHSSPNNQPATIPTASLNLGLAVSIPESYIPEMSLRLQLYRQAAGFTDIHQISLFGHDLQDRFGPFPQETQNFLDLMRLKILCHQVGIEKLDVGDNGIVIRFLNNTFKNPAALIDYIAKHPLEFKIKPDQRLVIQTPMTKNSVEKVEKLLNLFVRLSKP